VGVIRTRRRTEDGKPGTEEDAGGGGLKIALVSLRGSERSGQRSNLNRNWCFQCWLSRT